MCGIVGIVRTDAPPDQERVARMLHYLAHRGPDGEGRLLAGQACLGHRRLALIDKAGGHQPMQSPDGRFSLVFNGEIYNWRELREELRHRWHFRTDSDTEVLLALLALEDESSLRRLNGMFAFFLWDSEEERGLAARDPLGVKPFVYSHRDQEFVFASEAKAIVQSAPNRPRAHADSILEYLTAPFFSGVTHSMFEGVETLGPGHLLRVSKGIVAVERWWRWKFDSGFEPPTSDSLRAGVDAAIDRSLRADAPIGAYLSGGLDSTWIAARAKVPCFTVSFDQQSSFDYSRSRIVVSDDEPFAALAERELELRRERVHVARAHLAADLDRLSWVNDALPAWEQEIAQLHLAGAASQKVKAVLVGDAADETHWGYPFLLDDDATDRPGNIIRRFGPAPIRRDRLSDPVAHFEAQYRSYTEDAGESWHSTDTRRAATTRLILERWLPRLLHNGDIHAMASSIESRVPFADIELLAMAQRIGPRDGFRNGVEKSALREAARGVLPDAIRLRRKSALPKDQANAEVFRSEGSSVLATSAGFLGEFLDLDAVRILLSPARPLDERERAILFRVICLAHWARHYGVRA